ncbi:variant surface glycoprotein (VSG)-related, putative [Trypanosoma brucei brucei TREU927]|uniref:Variant surface glycoprotein (VSG)-related, putative n=1 Tax=Trypanosoma brucei brucei (strain 927/4 GUTat10.1) TaxID=185431 RepID=Q4GY74_TRYB2|nr:variant surface glycoprotein (VSG)-related, putative [Trypanosoma brucei brucei TREU927]CAJ16712.1 variant surface glycoprotein (VSG)-related, putative [Trypanosoma brucei brucei TREU927]
MWKKSVELIVGVTLVMTYVSSAEQVILNTKEFQTLCGFVRLTEQINELLERMKGKPGVDVLPLQKKVKDILFGTRIGDVGKMNWGYYRELDCGQDSGNHQTKGGEALMKDLVCLCEGTDQQSPPGGLCYEGNTKKNSRGGWNNAGAHRNTWTSLKSECTREHGEGLLAESEFQEMKKQLKERLKERKDIRTSAREGTFYTYGGNTSNGLQTCSGAKSDNDGICVMYPKESDGDNTSGIEWLNELEGLVKEVEKMNKDESAGGNTKPSTDGQPSMEKKPKSNTKPSTGENSPAKGLEGSQKDGNPNAQTTTSTEKDATTARPPEEQKSSSKIILQFLWIFLFWLFV